MPKPARRGAAAALGDRRRRPARSRLRAPRFGAQGAGPTLGGDGDRQGLGALGQVRDGLAGDGGDPHEAGDVHLVGRVAGPVVVDVRRREELHARDALRDEAGLVGRLQPLRRHLRLDARDEADAAEHVRPLGRGRRPDHAERRRAEPADAVDVEHRADPVARTHGMLDVVLRPEHAGLLARSPRRTPPCGAGHPRPRWRARPRAARRRRWRCRRRRGAACLRHRRADWASPCRGGRSARSRPPTGRARPDRCRAARRRCWPASRACRRASGSS